MSGSPLGLLHGTPFWVIWGERDYKMQMGNYSTGHLISPLCSPSELANSFGEHRATYKITDTKMKYPFPSEVEYMPLRSELERARREAEGRDTFFGFVFLVIFIVVSVVLFSII